MTQYDKIIDQLKKLETESTNPGSHNIDSLTAIEIARKINDEDAKVAGVVKNALVELSETAEMFADVIKNDGRVVYIGAGTSGRLGVLDAAECPPTFGTDSKQIMGLISGGYETLVQSKEGVEDDQQAAETDLKNINLSEKDLLIAIAASTRTPYTLSALEFAQKIKARTVFIVCNNISEELAGQDVIKKLNKLIGLPVGAEVITGSTRMKSGTAQKMALNIISTTAMVLLGKTYGNLMVDLMAKSAKLKARSLKILSELLSIDSDAAEALLREAQGSVKMALVMKMKACSLAEAKNKIEIAGGFIRKIK